MLYEPQKLKFKKLFVLGSGDCRSPCPRLPATLEKWLILVPHSVRQDFLSGFGSSTADGPDMHESALWIVLPVHDRSPSQSHFEASSALHCRAEAHPTCRHNYVWQIILPLPFLAFEHSLLCDIPFTGPGVWDGITSVVRNKSDSCFLRSRAKWLKSIIYSVTLVKKDLSYCQLAVGVTGPVLDFRHHSASDEAPWHGRVTSIMSKGKIMSCKMIV